MFPKCCCSADLVVSTISGYCYYSFFTLFYMYSSSPYFDASTLYSKLSCPLHTFFLTPNLSMSSLICKALD